MAERSVSDIQNELDMAISRFARMAANAPGILPLREHAARYGTCKMDLDREVSDYLGAEVEVRPDGVTWRFPTNRGAGFLYTVEVNDNGSWVLNRQGGVVGGVDQPPLRLGDGAPIRDIDAQQLRLVAQDVMDDMQKYLDFYVEVPAPRPDPNAPTVVIPAIQGQPAPVQQPSGTTATIALICAILAVPLTFCCILPGYAAFFLGLFMSRTEINRCKRAGMPVSGTAQSAWIISLIDIPLVVLLTVFLIVSRVSGFDSGGGY